MVKKKPLGHINLGAAALYSDWIGISQVKNARTLRKYMLVHVKCL